MSKVQVIVKYTIWLGEDFRPTLYYPKFWRNYFTEVRWPTLPITLYKCYLSFVYTCRYSHWVQPFIDSRRPRSTSNQQQFQQLARRNPHPHHENVINLHRMSPVHSSYRCSRYFNLLSTEFTYTPPSSHNDSSQQDNKHVRMYWRNRNCKREP